MSHVQIEGGGGDGEGKGGVREKEKKTKTPRKRLVRKGKREDERGALACVPRGGGERGGGERERKK